jgi:hypothetical protein
MPELTDSVVEALLPAGEPPELLPEGVSRDFFNARLRARATELERRIFQWLTLYQAIAERRQMDREFPGYQFTTCGFVPVSGNVSADLRTVGGTYSESPSNWHCVAGGTATLRPLSLVARAR